MGAAAARAQERGRGVTVLDALADAHLLGAGFPETASWSAWYAALAATFGLPMTPEQMALFRQYARRTTPPATPAREAWFVVGRRGGKSRIASAIAIYLACFRDYRPMLAPGERGTVALIAADRSQARTLFRYVAGLLDSSAMLARLIERRTSESIDLTNGVTIEVHTASFRTVRGYTIVGAVLDEVAFWRSDDSANPDREILDALRPAMATVSQALLVAISSPYARRGVLWEIYRKHHGQDGDVLVWQAPTRAMNPRVPEDIITRAYADDAAAAAAEYGAEFRSDLEAFVPHEVVEACTISGRQALPPRDGVAYAAFVDPSGGSADSFTLAIAHREDERCVVDVVRERRAPLNPSEVVAEFAAVCATYDVSCVTGDRYAGEWPREAFRAHGITYEPADRPKSDLYRDLLPELTSGRVELLDHPPLRAQLCALERRTGRGGRDTIDHPPGGHDDVANAVAGAVVVAGGAIRNEFLFLDDAPDAGLSHASDGGQLRDLVASLGIDSQSGSQLRCGTCANAVVRGGGLWCEPRLFGVSAELPACTYYLAQ